MCILDKYGVLKKLNRILKMKNTKFSKKLLLLVSIALILCITELSLLVFLFPQTGLSRIFYIPFWIFIYIVIALLINSKIAKVRGKEVLLLNVIFHIIAFHIMLYSWPQSAALTKNLIVEFYDIF